MVATSEKLLFILKDFCREVSPLTIFMADLGIPHCFDRNFINSVLALPSSGGAKILIFNVFFWFVSSIQPII